jgi:hypothetical protein
MNMQDDENVMQEAQEMLRQLVQLRVQMGAEQFSTIAERLGLPPEVLEIVEEAAGQVEGDEAEGGPTPIQPRPLDSLVRPGGQPVTGGATGLVLPDGTPYRPQAESQTLNGSGTLDEDDTEDLLSLEEQEAQAQQMFQELLGVRLVIGDENFNSLAERMGMSPEASDAISQAAGEIDQQIADRYPDEDEGNTVRLLNARMMMGEERFSELAEQVGMPQEMRDGLEDLAAQIEAQQGDEPDLQA